MILNTLAATMIEKGIPPTMDAVRNELITQVTNGQMQFPWDQIDTVSESVFKIMGGQTKNVAISPTPYKTPVSHAVALKPPVPTKPISWSKAGKEVSGDWPHPLSAIFDNPDDRDYLYQELASMQGILGTNLPPAIDHTTSMSPIKDQRRLGSCVAFAAAAMKEWQENKEHTEEVKKGKTDHRNNVGYDYSEQWIYYSCKNIDPWPNMQGTSVRHAMKVLNKIGVPTEKAWPYNDQVIGEPKGWAHLVARWATIGSYYRITTLEEMKNVLVEKGPFVIGMLCFAGIFGVGRDGVVPNPNDGERILGGHAVCVIGYDDERKLLKFKNSWGTGWGRKGYGYISYEYVSKYVVDAWVAVDMAVKPEMLKGAVSLI